MKNVKSLDANEILQLIFIYLTEVSSLRKFDEIISVLADMGRALTGSDRCTVWMVSDDKKKIWTKVAQGMDNIEIPIDSGIVGAAITKQEKIIIEDVYNDKRFNPEIDKQTGYITKSMMVIPMFDNDDEVIGAFQVINHKGQKGVFEKRDMQRLMLASTYAAETIISVRLTQEVEDTQREVVFTMGAVGESRSKETGNHVRRVAEYSKILALAYGLPEDEAELLKQASPMHDIGKVAIPDSILNKPGRFNDKEREIMNTHAELGYGMINKSERPLLKAAAIVAYEHHEKWDGTGYPRGLDAENIHIYGRITAIADVFDALGSDRVYKKAWSDDKILKLFKEERGHHFDPNLVDIFFKKIDDMLKVRDTFKDKYKKQKIDLDSLYEIKVLGAYGSKARGYGTSSFLLNKSNVIDAGNLLVGLEEKIINIEHIWLTHAHLDHISDIAYMMDVYFNSIYKTIYIHALPSTIKAIKNHFLNDILWPDFSKINLVNGTDTDKCIEYVEIELDKEYEMSKTETIKTFKTYHTIASCGYIYKKNQKSILITADTVNLENVIEILNNDKSITSAVLECSFPSEMNKLALASKHLTPKMISFMLEDLKREDMNIYINHIKPLYLNKITKELNEYCIKWTPKILKDGEIIKF